MQGADGFWDRAKLHRDRFSPRVLLALSRLCEILSRSGRWRATAISRSTNSRRCRSVGGSFYAQLGRCSQELLKSTCGRWNGSLRRNIKGNLGEAGIYQRRFVDKLFRRFPNLRHGVRGCSGLISFGVAGGLSPSLEPGACVIGSAINRRRSRTTRRTDSRWLRSACGGSFRARSMAPILGVREPIANHGTAKRRRCTRRPRARSRSNVKSHVVARAAAMLCVPFAAIRVVIDPVKRHDPRSALARNAARTGPSIPLCGAMPRLRANSAISSDWFGWRSNTRARRAFHR